MATRPDQLYSTGMSASIGNSATMARRSAAKAAGESVLPKAPRPPKTKRPSTIRNQRIIRRVSLQIRRVGSRLAARSGGSGAVARMALRNGTSVRCIGRVAPVRSE